MIDIPNQQKEYIYVKSFDFAKTYHFMRAVGLSEVPSEVKRWTGLGYSVLVLNKFMNQTTTQQKSRRYVLSHYLPEPATERKPTEQKSKRKSSFNEDE